MPIPKKPTSSQTAKTVGKAPSVMVAMIRKKLKHLTHEWKPRLYMDTGSPELNSVLGSIDRGIPYGHIVEVSGMESQGKTIIGIDLAAQAQSEDATIIWADFENSFDGPWVKRRGLDPDRVIIFQPYVGTFNKERRLSTAEELLEEIEEAMNLVHHANPEGKICLVVDSVTAMLAEDEAEAGMSGQNMKTNNALPVMLGHLLRRWIALLQEYNAVCIMINQLRTKPNAFGDPNYTTGGNALRFFAHSRVRLRRVGGGLIKKSGKAIGLKGIIKNWKNKSGGIEQAEAGYKLYFDGRSQFVSAAEIKDEIAKEQAASPSKYKKGKS